MICTEAKRRFYSILSDNFVVEGHARARIFHWVHGLQPLLPTFLNANNTWMIWTVSNRHSGCENWFVSCASILRILKDQIYDLWLTLWISVLVMKASLSICSVSLCWKVMNLWGRHQNFCFRTVVQSFFGSRYRIEIS